MEQLWFCSSGQGLAQRDTRCLVHSVITSKVDDGWRVEHTPQMYKSWLMGHSTEWRKDEDYEDNNTLTTGDDATQCAAETVTAASLQEALLHLPSIFFFLIEFSDSK